MKKSKESNIFRKFETTPMMQVIDTMNTKELKEIVTHHLRSGEERNGKSDKRMFNENK